MTLTDAVLELQKLPGPFKRSLQAAMRSIHLRTQTHIGGKLDGNNSFKLIKERRVLLEALCRHDLFDADGNHGSPRAEWTTKWFEEQIASLSDFVAVRNLHQQCFSTSCRQRTAWPVVALPAT